VKPFIAALLVALVPPAVWAAAPVAPDAGFLLQEIQPSQPFAPSPTEPPLTVERTDGRNVPRSPSFMVRTIRISGNTVFATATLHALVADADGKTLTLPQLGERAARITDYYHQHGNPLAQAIIPAQAIRDGVVLIEVIEARYGEIRLNNRSRVSDLLLKETLSPPLESGRVIGQPDLDHALLLLSDVPGVVVNATLKPGEAAGTADLIVDSTPGSAVSGSGMLDNYGDPYTGRVRASGTLNLVDPLHHGDILSVSGLSSGDRLDYGRIAYEYLLNGDGTRLGASSSALHYTLGGPLAPLDAHGTAQTDSLWVKQALVRSRNFNLYGQVQYDWLQLRDHVDEGAIRTDRHLENWTVSLAGDVRDSFLSGATTVWRVDGANGRVVFDDGAAQLADAATAGTQGGFSKWNVSLCRLQSLGPRDGLYLLFSGQWANTNLDSAEQMVAGGPYTVRAYDIGAISGDTGYLGTAEFRHELGQALGGQWQAVAFFDRARVTVNKTVWSAGANTATLSGPGLGLNWAAPHRWSAKISVARRIGTTPVLVQGAAALRAWVEIGKGF
jgi:hemolysin activation/secretion protein